MRQISKYIEHIIACRLELGKLTNKCKKQNFLNLLTSSWQYCFRMSMALGVMLGASMIIRLNSLSNENNHERVAKMKIVHY